MKKENRVEMVDYDQVRERGRISFISSKGNPLSVWINKETFSKLMVGPWNKDKMGEPHLYQRDLKEALKATIGTDYIDWFINNANDIMKRNTVDRNEFDAS